MNDLQTPTVQTDGEDQDDKLEPKSGADKPTTILSAEKRGIPERSRAQYERNQKILLEARQIREQRYPTPVGNGRRRTPMSNANFGRGSDFRQDYDGQAVLRSKAMEGQAVEVKPVVNDAGFDGVVDSRVIPDAGLPTEFIHGVLELLPNEQGYLRPEYVPSNKDVYVSASQVRRFGLKHGDMVGGQARRPKENERFWGLLKVETINDFPVDEVPLRPDFDTLDSEYPDEQIVLATSSDILSTRLIDLIAPIGKGQRGLIVSPPKAGKTTLLKNVATGVAENYPEMHLIALLIGERPEEVTDMNRNIKGEVIASNFDQTPDLQVQVAELGLSRAKRLVEMGKDVIILMDSITRLARAYNMMGRGTGRTMSGGYDAGAIFPVKRFLGAARKLTKGGSLTIIGTALIDTGSRMDELIYEEFKGTGNMELHLDRRLAERRVFPAIDVQRSGTRQEELLYDKEIYPRIVVMRRMLGLLNDDERTELLVEKLKKYKTNKEFLMEVEKAG